MITTNNKNIILASGSPRRSFLLQEINIPHKVIKLDFDESIPPETLPDNVASTLAENKSAQIPNKELNTIYITADTVVILDNNVLGKPKDKQTAIEYLKNLSNTSHNVITGVCLSSTEKKISFQCISKVFFKALSIEEITYYVENYKPFDKAGAYGIQEWIGMIGITKIEGSYFNIMGLPTHELKIQLEKF